MEKTIKNMEIILLEIKKNVMTKRSNSKVPKTLIHSYLTMLNTINRMYYEDVEETRSQLKNQSFQLKNIRYYIKENKMQELFNANDYVGINNYATVLDKIEKALSMIGEPKDSEATSSKIIEELLNKSVETGTLITFYDETHRGMGKTTALIKKAHELDAVLIAGRVKQQRKHAQNLAKSMGLDVAIPLTIQEVSLPQYRHKLETNGYLIDELVHIEDIRKLENYKLLGGFTRIVI